MLQLLLKIMTVKLNQSATNVVVVVVIERINFKKIRIR